METTTYLDRNGATLVVGVTRSSDALEFSANPQSIAIGSRDDITVSIDAASALCQAIGAGPSATRPARPVAVADESIFRAR